MQEILRFVCIRVLSIAFPLVPLSGKGARAVGAGRGIGIRRWFFRPVQFDVVGGNSNRLFTFAIYFLTFSIFLGNFQRIRVFGEFLSYYSGSFDTTSTSHMFTNNEPHRRIFFNSPQTVSCDCRTIVGQSGPRSGSKSFLFCGFWFRENHAGSAPKGFVFHDRGRTGPRSRDPPPGASSRERRPLQGGHGPSRKRK